MPTDYDKDVHHRYPSSLHWPSSYVRTAGKGVLGRRERIHDGHEGSTGNRHPHGADIRTSRFRPCCTHGRGLWAAVQQDRQQPCGIRSTGSFRELRAPAHPKGVRASPRLPGRLHTYSRSLGFRAVQSSRKQHGRSRHAVDRRKDTEMGEHVC